jgi:hypothetical protein
MSFIDKIFNIMGSQIKKPSVKLPKKRFTPHKIKDDNQAISIGVINEESDISLRSTSTVGKISG